MTQVAPQRDDDPKEAMRREAAYYTQIVLPSGRTITGEEAVAFTSMFAGRTSNDIDDDPGDLCDDCSEPMAAKRHRLALRAAFFHKIAEPTRHWWERHHKKR